MTQAARYMSINAVPGSPGMFDVGSLSNSSVKRRVKMSQIAFTPPECSAHAVTKGFPCYHGAAVIMQQHGAANMYKFVDKQHHTAAWKAVYEGATYEVSSQHVVDGIMPAAKNLVLSGDYLHQSKAIPPRRGRPVTDAGTRKQAWYEQGAAKTTRVYLCSLCECAGHTRDKCELRQLFGRRGRRASGTLLAAHARPLCLPPSLFGWAGGWAGGGGGGGSSSSGGGGDDFRRGGSGGNPAAVLGGGGGALAHNPWRALALGRSPLVKF